MSTTTTSVQGRAADLPDFQLSKMTVVHAPANHLGNTMLASFEMTMAGMRFVGCALVEKADGSCVASGPFGWTKGGHVARVMILDANLRRAVTERAVKLYEGHTGRTLGAA